MENDVIALQRAINQVNELSLKLHKAKVYPKISVNDLGPGSPVTVKLLSANYSVDLLAEIKERDA